MAENDRYSTGEGITLPARTDRTFPVIVGVALHRPPTIDQWRRVIVSAADETAAQLLACQISACTSLMPVVSLIDREKEVPHAPA